MIKVFLFYGIRNLAPLLSLRARFSNILEAANLDCLKVVVGTKLDLIKAESDSRDVTFDEGQKLAMELNSNLDISSLPHAPYFETSSLLDENIQKVFDFILDYCLPLSAEQKSKQEFSKNSVIDLMEGSNEHSRKCC